MPDFEKKIDLIVFAVLKTINPDSEIMIFYVLLDTDDISNCIKNRSQMNKIIDANAQAWVDDTTNWHYDSQLQSVVIRLENSKLVDEKVAFKMCKF